MHHDLTTILLTLLFTLVIVVMYLARKAPKIGQGFILSYFITDNLYRIIFNVCLTAYLLVGGEWLIHFLYEALNKHLLSKWDMILNADGSTGVVGVSLISSILSYFIFKFWKPVENYKKEINKKMHVHNENCNH